MMSWEDAYDFIWKHGIATIEELNIACHFGGCRKETMDEVVFYKTGFRAVEDLIEEEEGE